MGVPDNPLLDLINKVRSWAGLGKTNSSFFSFDLNMAENCCCQCELRLSELCQKYSCLGCRRMLCSSCVRGCGSFGLIDTFDDDKLENIVKACKFCSKASKRHIEKIYPSVSPRTSPEPVSPSAWDKLCSDEIVVRTEDDCVAPSVELDDHNFSLHKISSSRLALASHPSQSSLQHSPFQSDEEPEESGRHFFSSASEYCHDNFDIDTSNVSFRNEFDSFRSAGSSPLDSPSRFNINTPRDGCCVQQRVGSPKPQNGDPSSIAVVSELDRGTGALVDGDCRSDEVTINEEHAEKLFKPLDFENNDHIWFPPPPEDEDDEAESNFFKYEDDDDVGASDGSFSIACLPDSFPAKESQIEEQRECLKSVIQGHFRALVSQLLQDAGIKVRKESDSHDWLDIVSNLAWQAANFVKPDTKKGGSMDPVDYVKIKCISSGSPNESTLVKGIVCTKNIKHKRMTSQYKTPRILLLGGSLEYQRAQNQLASFSTLLEQEMNHLKVIVSKIEVHRPNVLLVEKSVASYAQDYLLEKEISLVLNVKRPVLERIARCTGALITPSVDHISVAKLGHCDLFRLEKVSEELETPKQFNRRPSKTLMFFEGCPKRLGCTVLLKGLCREELKRVKHVVQYAIFAAYHLFLETSFLADEGAHLPKMTLKPSYSVKANLTDIEDAIPTVSCSDDVASGQVPCEVVVDRSKGFIREIEGSQCEEVSELLSSSSLPVDATSVEKLTWNSLNGSSDAAVESKSSALDPNLLGVTDMAAGVIHPLQSELLNKVFPEEEKFEEVENTDEKEVSGDYLAATESQQSILVSFSSRCVSKGTLCERSRLLRIRFYGSFDKPLGRYLCDDLFDQASVCRSCKEPVEAHVQCYTHRQGVLTINVRRLGTIKLPGERDGKIWMWHRCLRCAQVDDVPPATRRVILSDAAWGLSFGKFLELSFSNHATANRVASCGHSLQRDCLRFYGFGNMVAFFHYTPIDILTVHLPSSMLEFNSQSKKEWMRREIEELKSKIKTFYADVNDVLIVMEQKSTSSTNVSNSTDLHKHILELKDMLDRERIQYLGLLEQALEDNLQMVDGKIDILELNQLRRSLLLNFHAWDRRFYSLDGLLNSKSLKLGASADTGAHDDCKDLKNDSMKDSNFVGGVAENECTEPQSLSQEEVYGDGEIRICKKSLDLVNSSAPDLSDKIDSAWTGTDVDASQAVPVGQANHVDNLPLKKLTAPKRVYSFDSAMRLEESLHRKLQSTSQLSAIRSFHASGDFKNMIKDPPSNFTRTVSQVCLNELPFTPSFISASHMVVGPRLLLPQTGQSDLVIAVYDDEPTSVISYALSSKEYEVWVSDDAKWSPKDIHREDSTVSTFLSWQSISSLELDYINYGSFGSEDALSRNNSMVKEVKRSPHLHISFDDDSSADGGKAKFSVICYFAKQFDMLQEKCFPSKLDFVRSLSRCSRWSAQGGKSNVYFAKSMDERFIIKQVTKTELESFQEFAVDYFKYLNDSLDSGSPTCLAKVLGIFQVSVKHLKGGRETKMDLMVMENLFFKRNISKIYDLKGSSRSRYNPVTTGSNNVLLDMNLLETLRTNPIFLYSKAKRKLERAVWNDTSFLASIDVMDYSLLVGVDEEKKELVIGIIDFMRQYTWDKHLETWVKASGFLGGLKNAPPTIISPKQYKRRFRKAMTTYFLTVPDQWSS
ncbi:putative 1-phosphatidylinositol-3-phosphate 5-kinase FAB1C [Amaranthus tricolor]|uniref:putative 1-phosphatidylinositol-3-phosphate 5-kinase FAB1C n=1 Tax=Amaranthus tricolor TaxID=29722 RepID=UPI0025837858|nr:putative 1-phosphatidylinositol-3-phosphate 5-kinase FAB1C [Amaranthus tricolor]